MKKEIYFKSEESVTNPHRYIIKLDFEKFPDISTSGSFGILPARLMGLSYAQYLRMCRDECGAEIIGKNCLYPTAYFKAGKQLNTLLTILNGRMNCVIFDNSDMGENNK